MSQTSETEARKRLRIDHWLQVHLQRGDLHGLRWLGAPSEGLFAVNWSHKSAHSWDVADKQNNVFLAYRVARYGHSSGCNRGGKASPPSGTAAAADYKWLKQNFRCALRGSRHLRFEKKLSQSRGCEARRVYRFLAEPRDMAASPSTPSSVEEEEEEEEVGSLSPSPDSLLGELPRLSVDADLEGILSLTGSPGRAGGGGFSLGEDFDADLLLSPVLVGEELLSPLDLNNVEADDKDLLMELFSWQERPAAAGTADCEMAASEI